jgi:hypothetical protein
VHLHVVVVVFLLFFRWAPAALALATAQNRPPPLPLFILHSPDFWRLQSWLVSRSSRTLSSLTPPLSVSTLSSTFIVTEWLFAHPSVVAGKVEKESIINQWVVDWSLILCQQIISCSSFFFMNSSTSGCECARWPLYIRAKTIISPSWFSFCQKRIIHRRQRQNPAERRFCLDYFLRLPSPSFQLTGYNNAIFICVHVAERSK